MRCALLSFVIATLAACGGPTDPARLPARVPVTVVILGLPYPPIPGSSAKLTAVAYYSSGSNESCPEGTTTWSVDNPTIATITSQGHFTAVAAGNVVIRVVCNRAMFERPVAIWAPSGFSAEIRVHDPEIEGDIDGYLRFIEGPSVSPSSKWIGPPNFYFMEELYLGQTVRVTRADYADRDFRLDPAAGTGPDPATSSILFRVPMEFTGGSGDTRIVRLPDRPDEDVSARFQAAAAGPITVRTWWSSRDHQSPGRVKLAVWCDGVWLHEFTMSTYGAGFAHTVNTPRAGECELRLYPVLRTESRLVRIDLKYPR